MRKNTGGVLRIALYLRISQDRKGEELGVARQEADCRKLAERLAEERGMVARITVFTDNDISASSYSRKKRPQYLAMCEDIRLGRFDMVVSWHDHRLIRQPRELETFIDLIVANQVDVHFCMAGRWELHTANGKMHARMGGVLGAYESDLKSERIKAAAVQHAAMGRFRGGPRPYGYEADGLTVRLVEAAEVVRMYAQVVAGVALRQIVADLNRRGVPTASGKGRWTSIVVRQILLRPRNAGLSSHLGVIVGKAEWPALVEEQTWRAAVAVLENPARRTQAGNTPRWLGASLYRCGVCEQAQMRVNGVSSKRTNAERLRAYRCVSGEMPGVPHVNRNALLTDDLVERTVVAYLELPETWEKIAAGELGGGEDAGELRLEQMQVRQRLDGLAEAFAGGAIDQRQLMAGSAIANTRMAEIDSALASLGMRSPLDGLSPETIRQDWFGVDDQPGMNLGWRRRIVDMLATVTVLPAPKGRRRDGDCFSPEFVNIEWN